MKLNLQKEIYTKDLGINFDGKFAQMDGIWFFVSLSRESFYLNGRFVEGAGLGGRKRPVLINVGDVLRLGTETIEISPSV